MIDERKLLAKLAEWEKESKEEAGLKAPALLRKVMEEVRRMAVNEEIRARIEAETESHARKWVSVTERLPEAGAYVLLSFEGCPLIDIGRYETDKEGGAFYPADCDGSYIKHGIIVNAWMPLPEPYREEREGGKTC